jgi:tellurite resistance protein TehA-like permease
MVFPLGMYAACTFGIAGVVGVDGLDAAAHWLTYVALVVWLLVFAGLVRNTIAMAQVPLLQNR